MIYQDREALATAIANSHHHWKQGYCHPEVKRAYRKLPKMCRFILMLNEGVSKGRVNKRTSRKILESFYDVHKKTKITMKVMEELERFVILSNKWKADIRKAA